jgi:hypothetical protein
MDFALSLPGCHVLRHKKTRPTLRRTVPAVPSGYIRWISNVILQESRRLIPCATSH